MSSSLLQPLTNLNFLNRFLWGFFLNIIFEHVFTISATICNLFTSCCFSLQMQLPESVFIDTTETSFVEKYDTDHCNISAPLWETIILLPVSASLNAIVVLTVI